LSVFPEVATSFILIRIIVPECPDSSQINKNL
jgi:hypothetical protein